MRLGLFMGYAPPGRTRPAIALAQEAERLGLRLRLGVRGLGDGRRHGPLLARRDDDELKVGAGIMQIPARTPAMTAMTAATLDLMSGGRFLLGLGTSGPQVVEGWHGQPCGKPLGRTREYVEIVRAALRRDVVELHGEHYDVPLRGAGASGLGSR